MAAGTICRVQLTASVQVGSDKKHDYSGLLTLQIGDDGAIDQGGLATNDGFHFSVVGQINDRLVGLHVSDVNGTTLTFTGVGTTDVTLCQGTIAGTFTGPKSSDFGAWSAQPGSGASTGTGGSSSGNAAPAAPTATAAPTGGGGTSNSTNSGGAGNSSGPGSSECSNGQVMCADGCTDITGDSGNCGACGTVCKDTEVCAASACFNVSGS